MRIQSPNAITKSAFCLHFHGKKNHSYLKPRFNARLQSYPKTDSPPISVFDTTSVSTCIEYYDAHAQRHFAAASANKKAPTRQGRGFP